MELACPLNSVRRLKPLHGGQLVLSALCTFPKRVHEFSMCPKLMHSDLNSPFLTIVALSSVCQYSVLYAPPQTFTRDQYVLSGH
jgi:hypothetical protein